MPAALQAAAFCIIWPAVCVWLVLGWTEQFQTSKLPILGLDFCNQTEPSKTKTEPWTFNFFLNRNPQILQFFHFKKVQKLLNWTSNLPNLYFGPKNWTSNQPQKTKQTSEPYQHYVWLDQVHNWILKKFNIRV